MSARSAHTFDNDSAAALLQYWQGALRLNDWAILVKITRHKRGGGTMEDAHQGECQIEADDKSAIVFLLDPVDYLSADWPQDHEHTLVHELLHIYFDPFAGRFRKGGPREKAAETAINMTAWALVQQRREGNLGPELYWEQ